MNAGLQLVKNDIRQIVREPMLIFAVTGPMLLLAAVCYGFPLLEELLLRYYGFYLRDLEGLLLSFFIQLIPLLIGTVSGFMMLDERDERLIQYFAVTPLGKYGYLRYRLLLPVPVCVLFCLAFILFGGLAVPDWRALLLPLLMLVMEAPMFTLFLLAFASNKIEGLALSKGAGLVVFAPLAVYFIPLHWQWSAALLPTYWPAAAIRLHSSEGVLPGLIGSAAGLLYHIGLFVYLLRRFGRMAE